MKGAIAHPCGLAQALEPRGRLDADRGPARPVDDRDVVKRGDRGNGCTWVYACVDRLAYVRQRLRKALAVPGPVAALLGARLGAGREFHGA